MDKREKNRRLAGLLALLMLVNVCFGGFRDDLVSYAYTERPASVNATSLNVRSGPGTTYSIVGRLSQGTAVTVTGEQRAADGVLWYQIRFTGINGVVTTGFVSNLYIKFPVAYTSDRDFEAHLSAEGFPESYKVRLRQLHAEHPSWVFRAQKTNLDWNTAVQNESVVGRNLVHTSSISSWKSIADGAYDWDNSSWPGFDGGAWVAASEDIIRFYMDPRNFLDDVGVFQFLLQSYDSSVHSVEGLRTMVKGSFLESSVSVGSETPVSGGVQSPAGGDGGNAGSGGNVGPGYVNSGPGVGGSAVTTTPDASSGTSSSDGLRDSSAPTAGSGSGVSLEGPHASVSRHETEVLATSYGPGVTGPGAAQSGPGTAPAGGSGAPMAGGASYIDIIMNAGVQSGVNPYVLAAMIIQEQGYDGKGGSISGREAGYEGYYNFFNIEAYQSGGLSAVQRGLWYASQSGSYNRPWNSAESSILGGAMYYGNNYVKVGQDTFYLKKFNVQGSNIYKHQYMTNVVGAASEAAVYAKAYSDEMKKTALEFKIPVFNNMPDNPSGKPLTDGSPNNKLSALSVNGFNLTPTFSKNIQSYDLIVDASVANVTVSAAAIDSAASVSGVGNISLQSGNNEVKVSVKAQNGSVREYVIHIVRQANGQTYSQPGDGSAPGTGSGPGGAVGPGGGDVTIPPS